MLCQQSVTQSHGSTFTELLAHIESNSEYWRQHTTVAERKRMGQQFTPPGMAAQLSLMAPATDESDIRIADLGAGTGILSTSLAHQVTAARDNSAVFFHGFETDKRLHADLTQAWSYFAEQGNRNVRFSLDDDFTQEAKALLETGNLPGRERPQYITSNPPFNKLPRHSELATMMRDFGVPVSNLYAAFTVLAIAFLRPGGHLLKILPRSFCSGAYFGPFRRFFMENMSVEHITLYKSRSCFKNVLQENLLIYASKKPQASRIRITVANDPNSVPEYDLVLPSDVILSPGFWALPRSISDLEGFIANRSQPNTLSSLGLSLSTGKTELHRLAGGQVTPVIYAADFDRSGQWVWQESRKPRQVPTEQKRQLALPPAGGFVVLKRISSNDGDEPQRLMPAWLSRQTVGHDTVTLDNHVQYIHRDHQPLTDSEGRALVDFLRSDEAQAVMRTINGTTQINRNDMGYLRLPNIG